MRIFFIKWWYIYLYYNYIPPSLTTVQESVKKFIGYKVCMIMSYLQLIFFFLTNTTTTSRKEVCRLQGRLCWKINLICLHSMKVSWSAYEHFSQLSWLLIYNTFIFCSRHLSWKLRGVYFTQQLNINFFQVICIAIFWTAWLKVSNIYGSN